MSAITLLPLDLTGARLANRIDGETHTLITVPGKPHRLLVPNHGGFYTEHVVVFDANNQVLTRGVDYVATYLYSELTELTGREVCGVIVIVDPTVTSTVRLNYRAVGGQFGLSTMELASVLESLKEENRPLTWGGIVGLPREYPSEPHSHEYWQVYGCESTVSGMGRVSDAIATKREAAYQHDVDYAEAYIGKSEERLAQLNAAIAAHVVRVDNPHQVTKAQVGLSLVQNHPFASQAEAEAGTSNERYMSVLRTHQAIASQAGPQLASHLNDRSDPHGVTAADVDTYTKSALDGIVNSKLHRDAIAADSQGLQGRSYTQIYNNARQNLNAWNVTGRLDPNRLGWGGATGAKVLRGDHQWVDAAWLFKQYARPQTKTIYIGYIADSNVATQHIQAAYSDINAYPIGSVILYTQRHRVWSRGTNGGATYYITELSVAIRHSGGWWNTTRIPYNETTGTYDPYVPA